MDHLPLIIGLIAGTCSTFAFVPQVLKIWREGDAHAVSFRMYVLRVIGFALWLIYGFVLSNIPLIVFNVLSIVLGGTVLVLKVKADHRSVEDAHASDNQHTLRPVDTTAKQSIY